jgi:hypothetical protein
MYILFAMLKAMKHFAANEPIQFLTGIFQFFFMKSQFS